VMALGMFDVVTIDLSRFSGTGSARSSGNGALAARQKSCFDD